MYISRKYALEVLKRLSREPYYQHDGEDYYVGVAEATGEIYSMPAVEIDDIVSETLKEIVKRIETEVWDTLSDGGDDWFASSKVYDAMEIIKEYISN
jgi:hypothetical protein